MLYVGVCMCVLFNVLVCVCVCFVMCGYFENCVRVVVICVLHLLCFEFFALGFCIVSFIYIYILFLFILSVLV